MTSTLSLNLSPLPSKSYFRAEGLGEGSFGAVLLVFDDDGQKYAAKRFEESEEGDTDCGTIREIAMLRILVKQNSLKQDQEQQEQVTQQQSQNRLSNDFHPNLVQLLDICTTLEEGGCLAMIMPVYNHNLFDLIESAGPTVLKSAKTQVSILWGCLRALRYLHDVCGIMHRDIKSDNIMLIENENSEQKKVECKYTPVLIDFSVAKFFRNDPMAHIDDASSQGKKGKKNKNQNKSQNQTSKNPNKQNKSSNKQLSESDIKNTTELGTATYTAPEIYQGNESYNEKSDVYSLGVVAYEIFQKKVFQAQKDKAAFRHIQEEVIDKLSGPNCTDVKKRDSPLSKLLVGMLDFEPSKRMSCRDAMRCLRGVVEKTCGLNGDTVIDQKWDKEVMVDKDSDISRASDSSEESNFSLPELSSSLLEKCDIFKNAQSHGKQRIKEYADQIEYNSAKTRSCAEIMVAVLELIMNKTISLSDPNLTDSNTANKDIKPPFHDDLDYCYLVLMAGKLYEPELIDCWELDGDWDPLFRKFDPEKFRDRELELGNMLSWNFYWKKGVDLGKRKRQ